MVDPGKELRAPRCLSDKIGLVERPDVWTWTFPLKDSGRSFSKKEAEKRCWGFLGIWPTYLQFADRVTIMCPDQTSSTFAGRSIP